jgi:hypothetical protein
MSGREDLRAELGERLWVEYRRAMASPTYRHGDSARAAFELAQRELEERGVHLDEREQRMLRWLCDGEVDTLAVVLALVLDR